MRSTCVLIGTTLALGLLIIFSGFVHCYFNDKENSANLFTSWKSVLWNQTIQSDFNAGVLDNVDIYSSPDDARLPIWYNSSWSYRKKITIDHTKVAGNLTDFPVLINLTSDSDLASYALDNGYDILFTSASGSSKLNHEIESFDGDTGKLIAWVRVPTLSSSIDTVLYMYFGNSGATNQQNGTGVWDANYAAVYHMSQSPTGTIYDSTLNHLDLTSQGGMEANNLVSGKIGNAVSFDGTDDFLNSSSTFTTKKFTLEAWVSNNNTGYWGSGRDTNGWECIVNIYDPNDPGNIFREFAAFPYNSINYGTITVCDNSNQNRLVSQQSGTAWRHIAVTYNNTSVNSGPRRGYLNGTITSYSSTKTWSSITGRTSIGAWALNLTYWTDYWWGAIDEVRISKTVRTDSWIETEYNNGNSPGTFYTIGTRESPSNNGTITSQVLDTGVVGALWNLLSWNSTAVDGTSISFYVRASDISFVKTAASPSWTNASGTSPVTSELPVGRYKQWRVTLNTNDTATTPVLHEVRTWYSSP